MPRRRETSHPRLQPDEDGATAAATSSPVCEVSRKRRREQADVEVLLGSFIVSDLPTNMAEIYTRAVRRMLPKHQKHISEADIMEEVDGATLTFEVTKKEVAEAMLQRLQDANVYGRRWKVEYYPLHAVQSAKEACLVDVRLTPAAPRALALRALSGMQGFLTLVDSESGSDACGGAGASTDAPEAGVADAVEHAVASFVDEGSALHARAMLSGRLVGASGVRMFLERHR